MPMYSIFSSHIESLIFPQFCNYCNEKLNNGASLYCFSCLNDNLELTQLGNWVDQLKTSNDLDEAFSLFWFDNIMQDCIHQLKYNQFKTVIRNVLKISIENKWLDVQQFQPYSIMIPIPLHHVKQRERGFNQALVIAQELFRFIPIPIHTKKIKRVLWTNSQTKLNITERRANVHNAFYSDSKFIDENILLIDDVLTTGATSSACAYTLKQNGVNNIGIFTLATSKLDS